VLTAETERLKRLVRTSLAKQSKRRREPGLEGA
jgi:hypothetical protein